jgi:dihydroorotase
MTTPRQDRYDVLLKGGTVIDPASGTNRRLDVGIDNGRIAAIQAVLDVPADEVIDCTNQYVAPGLLDAHTHIFEHVSRVGAPADEAHLRRGVVAAADAGTAGASTWPAFKKLVVDSNRMRIVSFLNVSVLGLIDYRFGELINPATLVPEDALAVAEQDPSLVRGFKIRLSTDVVGGRWKELLEASITLAEQATLPLMVHIGETESPLEPILDLLRPGDIVAHCYTGKSHGILEGRTVSSAVRDARERGVLFDSAHGRSNLSFDVAKAAIADGFLPDLLTSDTSARNWRGPVFDLLTSVSKLVALGVPLEDCIHQATVAPAEHLGLDREGYGRLEIDGPANVTVIDETSDAVLGDATGQTLIAPRYEPTAVFHHGERVEITPWRGIRS